MNVGGKPRLRVVKYRDRKGFFYLGRCPLHNGFAVMEPDLAHAADIVRLHIKYHHG